MPPTRDHNVLNTNDAQVSQSASGDGLRANVFAALANLLGPEPSLRLALEMRWILLLIITATRKLSEPVAIDKFTWIEDILELAENDGGLRQRTGELIANFFENAPWGLQKQPGSSAFDTVNTVNAISAAVVEFSRALAAELKKLEQNAVDMKEFDVEEAWSDSEDGGAEDGEKTKPKASRAPRNSKQKRATASKTSTNSRGKQSGGMAGPGNHDHGRPIPWTTPEHIGLLELYRDNTDRKTVSHPRIAELHNARFWPRLGKGRSNAAVSQQYLKLVQHDLTLILAKIIELQALIDEAA